MAHYIIRPQADFDLDECAGYIAKDNIDAAIGLYDSAEDTFNTLATFKEMGEAYTSHNPELKNVRFYPIKHYAKYLVFYIPFKSHIEIIRVLRTSRNIRNILK